MFTSGEASDAPWNGVGRWSEVTLLKGRNCHCHGG